MSNSQIDPLANAALKNLIKDTPKLTAKDVMNSVAEEIKAQKPLFPEPIVAPPAAPPMAENALSFVYFATKKQVAGGAPVSEEWTVDLNRTTSFCFEWRAAAYLVIQGPYTPICFALRRAFYIGEVEAINFQLKDRVFIPLDSEKFPNERLQQDMLNIAGNGNPTSGV